MFKPKHKIFSKLLPLFLIIPIIAVSLWATVLRAQPVHAIPVSCPDGTTQDAGSADAADHACDNHQAGNAALCYAPLFPGASVMECADRSDHFPNDTNGGALEDGHCYTARSTSLGVVYHDTGCDQDPFKSFITTNHPNATLSGTKYILLPTDTAIDKCAGSEQTACGFLGYVNTGIKFLGAAIGIVATIMIIVGGIQYSQSGGDPQAAAAAKKRITNAIFTLVAFGLLMAVLQWIVPGGIF